MALDRREWLGLIPLSALSLQLSSPAVAQDPATATELPLITSPPVVQHPTSEGFTVAFAVSVMATGWVEWGLSADRFDQKVIAAEHGLVCASDRALTVRVHLTDAAMGQPIFYRVVAQPLSYKNAYQLQRGEPVMSAVHRLRLPGPTADRALIAIVNDTHENKKTIAALHARLAALAPDLVIWNGDTCNDFDLKDDPLQIVLNPAGDVAQGWATERPLLFVPGNHDVRGARARELATGLSGWPMQTQLPYNFALRCGPVALVGLDTGEDKPDNHPVFAGTAAYEPYRELQATWLKAAVERPEIVGAPLKLAVCHIPLRGLPGTPDGTTLDGYASYSGMGHKLWLPTLQRAGFAAVISGHTHQQRVDEATDANPILQIVGGGPQPERATLIVIEAEKSKATLRVEDLAGKSIHQRDLKVG